MPPTRITSLMSFAESPASFECRTVQVNRLAAGIAGGGNIVIGRVVAVHVRDDLLNERLHVDPVLLAAIGRMGGTGFTTTRVRFDLPFGREALNMPDPLEE